jgi:hypothetical protein
MTGEDVADFGPEVRTSREQRLILRHGAEESCDLERYTHALDRLIRERFILGEDRDALLQRGGEEWDYAMK